MFQLIFLRVNVIKLHAIITKDNNNIMVVLVATARVISFSYRHM